MPTWIYALLGGWQAAHSLRAIFVALAALSWALLLLLVSAATGHNSCAMSSHTCFSTILVMFQLLCAVPRRALLATPPTRSQVFGTVCSPLAQEPWVCNCFLSFFLSFFFFKVFISLTHSKKRWRRRIFARHWRERRWSRSWSWCECARHCRSPNSCSQSTNTRTNCIDCRSSEWRCIVHARWTCASLAMVDCWIDFCSSLVNIVLKW